jgi:hypothetical protein
VSLLLGKHAQTCALAQQRRRLHPRGRARSSHDCDRARESDRETLLYSSSTQGVFEITTGESHVVRCDNCSVVYVAADHMVT